MVPGIQVADIIARFCTQRMNDIIASKDVQSSTAAGILGSIRDATNNVYVNIVSTNRRAALFFG
jgi:hypothetical protein